MKNLCLIFSKSSLGQVAVELENVPVPVELKNNQTIYGTVIAHYTEYKENKDYPFKVVYYPDRIFNARTELEAQKLITALWNQLRTE